MIVANGCPVQNQLEAQSDVRPLSPAIAAANRDMAGLLLFYADKKAWREGRDTEVIERALRRVRIVWWALGTAYVAGATKAALKLLASGPDPEKRIALLLGFLVLTVATVMVLRRGAKMTGALEAELGDLGSPVPTQKPFVAAATIAFLALIIL